MNSEKRFNVVISGLLIANLVWLAESPFLNSENERQLVEEQTKTKQEETAEKPKQNSEPKPAVQMVNVQTIKEAVEESPSETQLANEQLSQTLPAPVAPEVKVAANPKVSTTASPEKSKKGPPSFVGSIPQDYREFERTIRALNGRVFVYDLTNKTPLREVSSGVLVGLTKTSLQGLSATGHIVTDELPQSLIKQWIAETLQLHPGATLEVVVKLPGYYQSGFEAFAKQTASSQVATFNDVDRINFVFTAQGLYINSLDIDGKKTQVSQLFSG